MRARGQCPLRCHARRHSRLCGASAAPSGQGGAHLLAPSLGTRPANVWRGRRTGRCVQLVRHAHPPTLFRGGALLSHNRGMFLDVGVTQRATWGVGGWRSPARVRAREERRTHSRTQVRARGDILPYGRGATHSTLFCGRETREGPAHRAHSFVIKFKTLEEPDECTVSAQRRCSDGKHAPRIRSSLDRPVYSPRFSTESAPTLREG
jgi:hypothetical protein